jgi:hypothetical protein
MNDHKQDMINVTGLWLSKNNKGTFMSGGSGSLRFWVFKNKKKRSDSDPDYFLKLTPNNHNHKRKDDLEEDNYYDHHQPEPADAGPVRHEDVI